MLFIGRPTYGHFTAETEDSLIPALVALSQAGVSSRLHTMFGLYIQKSRNMLVEQAKAEGVSHLLFLDSDMQFEPDAILRLMAHKVPVVAGMYRTRLGEWLTTKIRDGEGRLHDIAEQPKVPFQVVVAPTGFMLIDMEVFARIPPPWFEAHYAAYPEFIGEDADFCFKCEAAGIPVLCDPTIPIGHVGKAIY